MPQKEYTENLLATVLKNSASDLHINVGKNPILRIDGALVPLMQEEIITPDRASDFAFSLLTPEQKAQFLKEKELDCSYNYQDLARFRVNIFLQRGFVGAALRLIPAKIRTLEELAMPPAIAEFTKYQQGF